MRARGLLFWLLAAALALPALTLSLVRLLEPRGGSAVRLESFTPLAVPAYAVVLALLLLALASGGRGRGGRDGVRRRRWPVALAALVALGGLGLHAWWLTPLYVGSAPAPAPGATALVVITSNLYEGHGDAIELVRLASERAVDVLVVQEITDRALAEMDRAGLASLLPYRIGSPDGAVAGTMVFAREPLGEPVAVATEHQSWQVTVGDPPGEDLTLIAVHPVAPVDVEEWHRDHTLIRAAAQSSGADLIVGDFNATLDHEPLRLLEDAGYRDAAELANQGWQPTWPANGLTPYSGLRLPAVVQIDHVLLGPRLTALGTSTVELPGTDHRVVVAEAARLRR